MAQQFLNGADVVTVLQKVRRKRVPERVARRLLGKAGLEHSLSDGTLDDRLVQMMAAALTRGSVDVESRRREHPLPGPFTARVTVLPSERPPQLDPSLRPGGGRVDGVLPPVRYALGGRP